MNKEQEIKLSIKKVTIEIGQHPNLKGMINVISDDYSFIYADLGTHHGLQCNLDEGSYSYQCLHSIVSEISKAARKLELIPEEDAGEESQDELYRGIIDKVQYYQRMRLKGMGNSELKLIAELKSQYTIKKR